MSTTDTFAVVSPLGIGLAKPDVADTLAKDVARRTVGEPASGSAATVTATDVSTVAAENILAKARSLKSNEIVKVVVDATSGNFTLTFGAQTTGNIAFNAAVATIETALVALSTIGAGDVKVTGGPGDSGGTTPYYIQFVNQLGGTNVGAVTATDVTLAGGGDAVTPSVVITGGETPSA